MQPENLYLQLMALAEQQAAATRAMMQNVQVLKECVKSCRAEWLKQDAAAVSGRLNAEDGTEEEECVAEWRGAILRTRGERRILKRAAGLAFINDDTLLVVDQDKRHVCFFARPAGNDDALYTERQESQNSIRKRNNVDNFPLAIACAGPRAFVACTLIGRITQLEVMDRGDPRELAVRGTCPFFELGGGSDADLGVTSCSGVAAFTLNGRTRVAVFSGVVAEPAGNIYSFKGAGEGSEDTDVQPISCAGTAVITGVAFDPHGTLVLSVAGSNSLITHDPDSNPPTWQQLNLATVSGELAGFAYHGDHIVGVYPTVSAVRWFNSVSGHLIREVMHVRPALVGGVAVRGDGMVFATAMYGNVLRFEKRI